MGKQINCAGCGVLFRTAHPKNRRCTPCRNAYASKWRAKRIAAGLPAGGSKTWDPAKREAWQSAYYSRPEIRKRRVRQMKESQDRHPERVQARRAVRHEIAMGRMQRQPCEVCKTPKAQAHHDDYSKPLAVRWLCVRHHAEHHAKVDGKVAP
jgi:hypothetical protein